MEPGFLVVAAVVLLSYTTQAMTGFGSTVIALTLGAHFFPLEKLLPILIALNLPQCVYMVARHHEHVDRELLLGWILPWMGLGLLVGIALSGWLSGPWLRRLLGGFVAASAGWELARLLRGREQRAPLPAAEFRGWLAAAGVVHGVYASGGPLLTYALSRLKRDKAVFRSTLMSVWLVLNLALQVSMMARGKWTADVGKGAALLLPLLPLGIYCGEWLHQRVPEKGFRYAIQSLLVVAGAGLLK